MNARQTAKSSGFTVIEVVIVLAVIGILAALAVPAFISYSRRAKTAEASANLKALFTNAATYYVAERTDETGHRHSACTVAATGATTSPGTPSAQKQAFTPSPSLAALGFTIGDPVYFGYGIPGAIAADCDHRPNTDLYTLAARGDLDGDGVRSTFELSVGSTSDNQLYRSPGFYIHDELE